MHHIAATLLCIRRGDDFKPKQVYTYLKNVYNMKLCFCVQECEREQAASLCMLNLLKRWKLKCKGNFQSINQFNLKPCSNLSKFSEVHVSLTSVRPSSFISDLSGPRPTRDTCLVAAAYGGTAPQLSQSKHSGHDGVVRGLS